MFKYLIFLFLLLGCGKFNLSPYISETKNIQHNKGAATQIEQLAASTGDSFKIAIISDTHDYYHELNKIIDRINEKRSEYAFIIVLGDITNIGLLREYKTSKKFLDRLKIPYLMAIGNHDLLTNGEIIYKQMFGKENYAFNFKQTRFVIYNNNNWESSYKVPDYNWVEDQLKDSTQTHHILLAHVSVTDSARFNEQKVNRIKKMLMIIISSIFLMAMIITLAAQNWKEPIRLP